MRAMVPGTLAYQTVHGLSELSLILFLLMFSRKQSHAITIQESGAATLATGGSKTAARTRFGHGLEAFGLWQQPAAQQHSKRSSLCVVHVVGGVLGVTWVAVVVAVVVTDTEINGHVSKQGQSILRRTVGRGKYEKPGKSRRGGQAWTSSSRQSSFWHYDVAAPGR